MENPAREIQHARLIQLFQFSYFQATSLASKSPKNQLKKSVFNQESAGFMELADPVHGLEFRWRVNGFKFDLFTV